MSWKVEVIIESKPSDSKFFEARLNSTEEVEEVTKDTFFDQVQAAFEKALAHFLLIVVGAHNARSGCSNSDSEKNGVMGKHEVSNSSNNQERLRYF